ncbi:MAG: response regulator [Chitinivibrionales bacterium]|nr:response regulator [Chitinivibrionales bacterium]
MEVPVAPKRVLIIDDEHIIRYTTSVLLKKHGIEALTAETGRQGIDAARQEQPDMILLDIMMPDMDGWAVIDELGKDQSTASIPVVLFTAGDPTDTQRRAEQHGGVQAVLRKPFRMEELLRICGVAE